MKRIVFCADGTWNHPHSSVLVEDGDTNVYKLYKSLAVTSDQLTFYDDGVGVQGVVIEKLAGGAFGLGLFQKVKDGYTALAHAYEEGDDLFIFGFSRGAYTARSVAGMIAICGLPTKNFDQHLVDAAFQAYRSKNENERKLLLESLAGYDMVDAKIDMLGVWDTVGSLGIPALFGGVSELVYGFLDTTLHGDVIHAYHALAVDERRAEFPPTLWTGAPKTGQAIEQVWFSGVHCDVGGGYSQSGLSDITLGWMIQKAKVLGLSFIDTALGKYAQIEPKHALDELHHSWNPLWLFPKDRTVVQGSTLANSVKIRVAEDATYRPKSLQTGINNYDFVPVVPEPVPEISMAAAAGKS